MDRTKRLLPMLGIVIGLGLAAAGCGPNQARGDTADPTPAGVERDEAATESGQPAAPSVEPEADRRETELRAREREIARQEEQLDRRMRELEARLESVEEEEPELVARDEPPTEIAVRDVEPEPRTVRVALAAGTPLEVEIAETLSSETNLIGDPVSAVVLRDVVRGTRVIVPAGSRVLGTVSDAVAQKKIGGQARLALDFDRLVTPSGQQVPIQARLDSEGRSQKKKDAATIGGSAAGGAVLGRVLSKDDRTKGTVLGAVISAAIGTAVASQNHGDPVVVEAGTVAELLLDAPTEVAVDERVDLTPLARNQ